MIANLDEMNLNITYDSGQNKNVNAVPNIDSDQLIVPILSKRKSISYNENINSNLAKQINSNLSNLPAKLYRISNPNFPAYKIYDDFCREIFGFTVTTFPSENRARAGI